MKRWRNYLLFIIFAAVAIGVTFYRFNLEPKGLAQDEIEFAKVIAHLSQSPYQVFTPLADGHPTVYFYILLLSTKAFGFTSFALRFPAALLGVISVFIMYAILKMTPRKSHLLYISIALWAAFIFATLRWRFEFTRFSFEMPYLLFLELMGIWCVLRATKRQSLFIVFTGLFAGLAYNSYQPGRIFFLVPLLFLIINKASWKKIVLYMGTFLIFVAPMTIYLYQHPADDIRIRQQSFIANPQLSVDKKVAAITQNVVSTALMFSVKGDLNGRHNYPGKPALNPILSIFFLLGLGLSLWKWREKYNALFLCYFVVALIPTLLTSPLENPHMLRTYTAIPSIIYFIGVATQFIVNNKTLSRYRFIAIFLVICYLLSAIYDVRTYFIYQPSVNNHAFPLFGDLLGILKAQKAVTVL